MKLKKIEMIDKINENFEENEKNKKSIDKSPENDKLIETQKTKVFFSSVLSSLKSFFESEKQIDREYEQEVEKFSNKTEQQLRELRWNFSINKKHRNYSSLEDREPDTQKLILESADKVSVFINETKKDSNVVAKIMANIADKILKS